MKEYLVGMGGYVYGFVFELFSVVFEPLVRILTFG